jgi:hypothetical protein
MGDHWLMQDKERKRMEQSFDPEKLRPVAFVCEPDPRSTAFARIDPTTGTARKIELSDYHEALAPLALHAGVPEDIIQQFETARNLYLYAWFIYRFYIVAEHQGLACLELALRDRLKAEISAGKIHYRGKKPSLRPLLEYAVQQGLVKNEGFEIWRNRGVVRSRERVEMEKLREMTEKKLDEITWDDSDIEVTAEDLDWDFVSGLVDFLPKLRNRRAHGSTELHNSTLNSIRTVCEIINQLYQRPE